MKKIELYKKVLPKDALFHPYLKRALIMFNWSLILTFLLCTQVYAVSYPQTSRVDLNLKSTSLKKALSVLEQRGDIRLLYSEEFLPNKEVSLIGRDIPVLDALSEILKETNLNYRVFGDGLVAIISPQGVVVQDIIVRGKVSDVRGEPLIGVSIRLQGTNTGVTTDIDGNFSIETPENGTLVFSYIGFLSKEVPVSSQTILNVRLDEDQQALDEVVVVGYGVQSRGTVTGSVGTVQADDIIRTSATTTAGALVGKVQGVTALSGDSRPGSATTLQIRNMGEPLYIIDGVPADAAAFNQLGLNDIENMSILKDASAAIYGLRASNGVVLVTTKKGAVGADPVVNVNAYYGMQNFTRFPEVADGYGYVRAFTESELNSALQNNRTPTYTYTSEDLAKWKANTEKGFQSYDYYDMVIAPNVPQYSVNANTSGGSDNTNFFVSVGYLSQDATIKDYTFNRYNLQANVDANITRSLKIGTQISGRIEDRSAVGVPGVDEYPNPFTSIYGMWPIERPYANDNPDYVNNTHNVNINPATYTREITGYNDEIKRVFKGNFFAQYSFGFGLVAKGTMSYGFQNDNFENHEYTYQAYQYDMATDSYLTNPGWGNQNPWRRKERRGITDRFYQFQLNYNKSFGEHSLAAVAAVEKQDRFNDFIRYNTVPANNLIHITRASEFTTLTDQMDESARSGIIGRLNYNYNQKYLVELLGRYDGSYLYYEDERWGFFPGVSLGWRISEEGFMDDVNFINDLKFRASYGQTGSELGLDAQGRYVNLNAFGYYEGYDYQSGTSIFDGSVNIGIRPRGIPVRDLSWVKNHTSNIGIDFSMFNSRVSGQVDVFQRKRTGLPASRYDVLLPSEVGAELPYENLNSDVDRGIEGMLAYSSQRGADVEYSIGVNATLSRQRILEQYKPRYGNSWDQYRNGEVDRWTGIGFGHHVIGQFQSQEEIDNYEINNDGQGNRTQLPGDLIFEDTNGDKVINEYDQRAINYSRSRNPYMSFGINGRVEYKNFTLAVDFAGATMQSIQLTNQLQIPFYNNGNSPSYLFNNSWHHADPLDPNSDWVPGKFPAIRKDQNTHVNYSRPSDFWTVNVHYIRLRNLELGYSLPKTLISKIGASRLRIYANVSNLFSIDNMKNFGIDPEVTAGDGRQYPQQRLYNFGLNITL